MSKSSSNSSIQDHPERNDQEKLLQGGHDALSNGEDMAMVDPGQLESTLVEIDKEYSDAGFATDVFVTEEAMLLCSNCNSLLSPDYVDIHSIRRLEGASDPADVSAIIALICPVCGSGGTAVLQYGPEARPAEVEIWQRTNDRRSSGTLPSSATPPEHAASNTGPA
jgi:Zn finger protein HypA/HybF involved in hydrogenase expression